MIRQAFKGLFAGLLGLMATAGLPVSIAPVEARRAGVVRKINRNKPRGEAGTRHHRRQYWPGRERPSCRFVYARADRQASREARMRVIARNDARTNRWTAGRLEEKGLRVA